MGTGKADRTPLSASSDQDTDQIWLKQQCDFEELAVNLIAVEAEPTKWHPKLGGLRKTALAAARTSEIRRAERDKAQLAKSDSGTLDFQWMDYSDVDEGGMIFDKHASNVLRVSVLTLNRALAIANALFYAAQTRGCTVGTNTRGDRLFIELESVNYEIAFRERQDFDVGPVSSDFPRNARHYRPTDKLAIVIERFPNSIFEVVDNASQRVEGCLNEIFIRLYRTVADRRTAEKALLAIAGPPRPTYVEVERRRAEDYQLKFQEEERRKTLIDESSAWQRAALIRAYSAHIKSHAGDPTPEKIQHWFDWATTVADQIDPTSARVKRV